MDLRLLMAVLVIVLLLAPSSHAADASPDRSAYHLDAPIDFRLLPNGLLLVLYADPSSDTCTHATLHRVQAALPAPGESLFSSGGMTTLYVGNGADGSVTYAVNAQPLFYGDHLAGDGSPARLWEDAQEDGLNGNEILVAGGFFNDEVLLVADLAP